jgi:hypothetical protein
VSMNMMFSVWPVVIVEPNVHHCDHKKLPLDPLLNHISLADIAATVKVVL